MRFAPQGSRGGPRPNVGVVVQGLELHYGVLYGGPDGLEGGDVLAEPVLVRLGEVTGVVIVVVVVRRVLIRRCGACGTEESGK